MFLLIFGASFWRYKSLTKKRDASSGPIGIIKPNDGLIRSATTEVHAPIVSPMFRKKVNTENYHKGSDYWAYYAGHKK